MPKIGRPTKISKARINAICESVGNGATYEVAASAAGIHEATARRWREVGEAVETKIANGAKEADVTADERLCAEFCAGIHRAEGEAETKLIAVAANCALGMDAVHDAEGKELRPAVPADGRLALEFLGRKHPSRWSRRIHVRDETPRTPAETDAAAIARFDAAFAEAFGEQLPELDAANLMPSIALDEVNGRNGHRNGDS